MSFHAIAIDGPAASGKSTMARAIASRLGIIMVNSGAMYRAVTWKILSEGIDPRNTPVILSLLNEIEITCGDDGLMSTILIDGVNPEPYLRNPEINDNVSAVSAIPEVREKLVTLQRDYLNRTHVVMEGRDIGSVVFPETPFKIYIDADPEVRNRRRSGDGEEDSVAKRDAADSSRKTAPLKIADGATVLDTSKLTIEEAIETAIDILRKQGFPMPQVANFDESEEPKKMMRWIYWFGWLLFGAAYRSFFGLRIIGQENLILSGPVLV
ncbi:MAG: (d)CMP kinase, partial [Akkermansiaceae bacterium]